MQPGRLFLLIFCIVLSQPAHAAEVSWLGGIYVDTMNRLNIKGGIALYSPRQMALDDQFHSSSIKYVDMEVGLEGTKYGVGVGYSRFESAGRVGLSYADLKGNRLVGIESVVSAMGASFKLGYYQGLDGVPNEFLVGVGFGF